MVNNHFNLLFSVPLCFNGAVIDHRTASSESCLETFADSLLAESRYWLGRHSINLYDDYINLTTEKRQFMTTADKIISFVKGFLLFLPGIFLKSIAWLKNGFKVYQRSQLIVDQLNKPENFIPNFDTQLHVIKVRTFSLQALKQEQNAFSIVPEPIKFIILSYLKNKDRGQFAKTCQAHYHLTADFYIKGLHSQELYPSIIRNVLQKSGQTQVPHGTLPKQLHYLLTKNAIENYKDLLNKPIVVSEFGHSQRLNRFNSIYLGSMNSVSKSMKDHPIQTLQTSEGLGLMIGLKKNSFKTDASSRVEQVIIIIPLQNEWIVLCHGSSGFIDLVMNDMRFYDEAPQLENYFERLFKGEPCGDFKVKANVNIQIDYKVSRASDVLQEGPRVLADGKTPVIQLYSA